ncbi:hypothetical protein [Tepidibacter hydrothermalis]|uniref:Flagellar hook-length control protein FliK n=1 Tax=Tepidibacter hydrothermalis TaxID=3036126 RepID=A0ABY8EAM1_9FIRM|nr:hypothetical protein [Tepidibacter hydrothermalis]WFD08965.1 hypothetical protein P4S50_11255 [Tepidibacter hydrothermalis]
MRISGYSDFNLRTIGAKGNKQINDAVKNNESVTGKILDVKSNAVKILLQNGKEFMANSNIPLENLLGEQVNFKVLNSDKNIVLQPQIEGTALEKELDAKINNLVSDLKLPNNEENKSLIKEMIKQNIPVNVKNLKIIKDNIGSFNILSRLTKEEVEILNKNIENIETKEMKEIVKDIYINKEGKNILDFLKDLKNIGPKEKNILFLFKNKFEINIDNMKTLDSLLKGEKLDDILKEINNILDEDISSNKSLVENTQENKLENVKEDILKLKTAKDEVTKLDTEKEVIKTENSPKEDIKKIIKSIVQNLNTDKKVDVEKIKQNMDSLVKTLNIQNEIKLGESLKGEFHEVNQKLELLNDISNEYMYFQIPFEYKEYKNLAEILLSEQTKDKKNNKKSISILISLDTHNLSRIDTMLNYYNEDLNIVFGLKDEKTKNMFVKNEKKLIGVLKSIGINNIHINYKIKTENEPILNNIEYINNKFSNFNMWV